MSSTACFKRKQSFHKALLRFFAACAKEDIILDLESTMSCALSASDVICASKLVNTSISLVIFQGSSRIALKESSF